MAVLVIGQRHFALVLHLGTRALLVAGVGVHVPVAGQRTVRRVAFGAVFVVFIAAHGDALQCIRLEFHAVEGDQHDDGAQQSQAAFDGLLLPCP